MSKFRKLYIRCFQWFYLWYLSFKIRRKFGKEVIAELKADRLQICENCEDFKSSTRQCKVCHCFMDIKAGLPAFECDKGYWGKFND